MKRELSTWKVVLATGCIIGLLLSGCAWQIGGDKKGPMVVQATKGQELIDLKKAREQDVITEEEYQAQRNKILER
jgi:hypothetical protein